MFFRCKKKYGSLEAYLVTLWISNGYRGGGAISLVVKPLKCEADQPTSSNSDMKYLWSYTTTPLYTFTA
jgi:hypothetical protein